MFESKINRGRANGYAPLDSGSKVPLSYLPPIQSTIDTGSLATTSSLNAISESIDSRVGGLEIWSSSLGETFATDLEVSIVSSSVAATIGIVSQATGLATTGSNIFNGNQTITGSLSVTSTIVNDSVVVLTGSDLIIDSGSINVTGSIVVTGSIYADNLVGLVSSSAQITELGFTSESNDQTLSTTSSVQFHDLAIDGTASFQSDVTIYGNLQVWGTQSVINSTNVELSDNILYLAPSGGGDFDLGIVGHYNDGIYSHAGIFSDASDGHAWKVFKGLTTETTGAYVDTNGVGYTLADFKANNIYGGIYATNGVVSGSSQLTSSYDTKYAPSASYLTSLNGTISGSSQLTSSFDTRYALSGSSVTINTGSLATTSSNSFNGTQTITGSLIVSSVAVVNGGVTIPTGSTITLTSGSSISVDASGAITGSLTGSVFGIGDVSEFSSSVNSRINNIVSAPAGTISGSSQLTSSFDTRYALSGSGGSTTIPDGTVSGSSQLTSSFDTRYLNASGDGVWSGSAQVNGNLAVTSVSASVFVGGYLVSEAKFTTLTAKPMTFYPNPSIESVRFTTAGGVIIGKNGETNDFGNKLDVSGSVRFIGNTTVTGSLIVTNGITGTISATNGVISGSSQLTSSYDTRYVLSGSITQTTWDNIASKPSGIISGSSQLPIGLISGSSQLTASYDTRYTLSGSVVSGTTPAGTISGSSQLTSSFDGRYTQTGSFNTLTASFNSFTASAQSVTTGSNSFNGTQTITGSLIISTGSFIGSQITANTASLYLTSGSNLYVQNNGVVEITGSLNVSGTSTLKVPVLYVGTGSGVEGGEIDLAYAQSGNTTLTGSAIVFDIWQDRVRIFENGGTNRGGYFDISTLGAGVGTDLSKLTYFIEAYANVSYTLPGSYTDDVCRYSVVSTNVNVPTAWFNTSTYTFTPLKAGYWEIIATYDVYRNGEASLLIKKNGTTVASAGAISSVAQQITKIIYMNGSTDYINIYNSGVQANARTQTSTNAFFQARFVGA